MHRLSSPRPKLRDGRRLALLSHLNLILNLCTLSFVLSLALLPPLLIFPNVPLPGSRLRSSPITRGHIFFVSQPKTLHNRAVDYLFELRRATCYEESDLFFCSPAKFLAAPSNLSSSTTGLDKVVYPMLKHFPRPGVDFLSHFQSFLVFAFLSFNLQDIFYYSHPQDGKASRLSSFLLAYLSHTSCVLKLFERMIISRLLFFLESNSILSPRQAGFRPGRSTLNQILYLSPSILNGFNKPRPRSPTNLATIDFSNAFDSVCHPALFHKLILAGLILCFARWTQSFLFDRRAGVVFQNHKRCSFRVCRGVPQGSALCPVLFYLLINHLPASLPFSVSCSLNADNLAIRSSSPSAPTAVEGTQGALV